jgi:hypothetical protein
MNSILKSIIKSGKNILKETTDEIVEQGKESIKTAATDKITGVVNSTIQNIGNKLPIVAEEGIEHEIEDAEFSEAAYQDADAFEEKLHGNLQGMVSSLAAGNPAEAKEVVNGFVAMAGEVTKFTEVQKTKRKEIEAQRDIIVEKIHSQKEIILSYLEKSFDERKENFAKLFTIVDSDIANNNMQQLAMGLDSINKLADSSPFKALASLEGTKLALSDKTTEWDF